MVALLDTNHFTLTAARAERIAVAPADVRHVDPEHPQQPVTLCRIDLAELAQETPHLIVIFRPAAAADTLGKRTAQYRHDTNIGSEQVLQEYHLELDRVLGGVAVILDERGGLLR
jgi:hypothetical protein